MLRLLEKTPDDVTQEEWELLTAKVRVFASAPVIEVFGEWGDAAKVTWDDDAPEQVRTNAYERAEAAQRRMLRQVVEEIQGG